MLTKRKQKQAWNIYNSKSALNLYQICGKMQPPFIKKMRSILDDPYYSDIVCWARQQTCIQIKHERKFEEFVLPKFFRHHHLTSFIRQLNLYGFRKIRCNSSLLFSHDVLENGHRIQEIFPKKRNSKFRRRDQEPKIEEPIPAREQIPIKLEEKESEGERSPEEKVERVVEKEPKKHHMLPEHYLPQLQTAMYESNYQPDPWMHMMSYRPMRYHYPSYPYYAWS